MPTPGFEPRTVELVERIGFFLVAVPHKKQWTAIVSAKFLVFTYFNGIMLNLR
jgi:hypothetical protein